MNSDHIVDFIRYVGNTWKNCGPSGAQKGALASDQSFQKMITQDYGTTFGENQQLFNNLTTGLNQITSAGPSQQGESAAELAAKNSQNINAAAASNQKLQTSIGENAAGKGISGAPGVESGVTQAVRAQAATDVDTAMNNQAANITKENYDIGRQNYWNATQATEAAPAAFENPSNQAAGEVTGSNQATSAQANANEANSTGTELLGLGEGLASDAATAVGGCVTPDTLITLFNGKQIAAQDLVVGDDLYGVGGNENIVKLERSTQPTALIILDNGLEIEVSESHTFAMPLGGYTEAWEALGKTIRTLNGTAKVVDIKARVPQPVIRIRLSGMHTYVSNGIWSLE